MMQRTICRFIRGTCRKFRENDCPTLASEEVRQKNKSKEEFTPPKHTLSEALGWTTGIILTYEFTHRQRRNCLGTTSPGTNRERFLLYIRNCPFAIAKEVSAQPIFSSVSTVKSVRSPRPKRNITLVTKKSIDTTPFLQEPEKFFPKDYPKRASFDEDSDDEEGIHFDPTITKYDEVRANKPKDVAVTSFGEKIASDLFSALGAFKMLNLYKGPKTPAIKDLPTMEALDILEKGVELGSSRALYNIGVAYDRLNETNLAKEYFQRAADLGHPLACYNVAIGNLTEGKLQEGMTLMQYAANNGVHEAVEAIKRF